MLARWLTTILPAMRLAEALEITRLHSVAGFRGWLGNHRLRSISATLSHLLAVSIPELSSDRDTTSLHVK
jgi:hypothetical protein